MIESQRDYERESEERWRRLEELEAEREKRFASIEFGCIVEVRFKDNAPLVGVIFGETTYRGCKAWLIGREDWTHCMWSPYWIYPTGRYDLQLAQEHRARYLHTNPGNLKPLLKSVDFGLLADIQSILDYATRGEFPPADLIHSASAMLEKATKTAEVNS